MNKIPYLRKSGIRDGVRWWCFLTMANGWQFLEFIDREVPGADPAEFTIVAKSGRTIVYHTKGAVS